MGSIDDARRVGINAAKPDIRTRSKVTPAKASGSCELPSAHFARTPLNIRLSRTPHTSPAMTLRAVEANTSRSTCHGVAPRAMRMPNSLVRCATP